jgi:D-alanyl-D-alanine carboxypeptidase/D-alanyl-D-alanine-endopeptidase (penicillin-binding protein 4)
MTGLLEDTEHGPDLLEALPVAGQSGTLRERLVGTAAEGRMRAKTGRLRDVVSLVGVVETLTGRTLAFAVVTNAEGSGAQVKALHDRVVLGLVPYPDGPPLELLGPLPVDG